MEIPVYLMAGFLDSGKTSFTNFTIQQDYFSDGSKTLLILCEEGEEEYDEKILKRHNTIQVLVESEADFTEQRLNDYQLRYRPERVVIEYNGMWRTDHFLNMQMPSGWVLNQMICLINAETFELYLSNMKSMVMEMVAKADMVIFNRCREGMRIADYRRSIKAVNRRVEMIFETNEGEMAEIVEELPYDLSQKEIQVEDDDYGIFYMDAMEHPEHYKGKIIKFSGMVLKPPQFPPRNFIPGRMAMTCCADDTTFIGFVCKGTEQAESLVTRDWVTVSAKLRVEYQTAYKCEGPVLYAETIEAAEKPEEELVYFN